MVSVLLFTALLVRHPARAQQNASLYVTKEGNDRNDGLSWQTAKLTVAGAVASLPHYGSLGSGGTHYGVVHIGPGVFVERGHLELNQGISYVGSQANVLGLGTTIRLADGANAPLFAYTSDWITSQTNNNAYSHYIALRDLDLDGNYQNNTSTTAKNDLVELLGGGYNTHFENVTFQGARRYGLYLDEKQVNFSCYVCTFAQNQGGAVYANDTGSGTMVTFVDTQLDDDGEDAITINTADENYANGGSYVFLNLKAEASAGHHQHIIRHNPAPRQLTFPPAISVIGSYAFSTGQADAMFYESSSLGTEARWNIQNAFAQMGYSHGVFQSDKSHVTSVSNQISQMISNDPSAAARRAINGSAPDLQLSSGVTITGGGDPTATVTANPGSLYLDHVNGALWLKETGNGTAGWVLVCCRAKP